MTRKRVQELASWTNWALPLLAILGHPVLMMITAAASISIYSFIAYADARKAW